MAAYTATGNLKKKLATTIYYFDILFPPPFLKTLESAQKELNYFQKFVERLDSSSRMRMSASLEQIAEAMRKFDNFVFRSLFRKLEDEEEEQSRESVIRDGIRIHVDIQEGIQRDTRVIIATLKKMEEEYRCEAVSSGAGSCGKYKSKMVGLCDEYTNFKEELLGHWVKMPFFSLAGMAGIGKTTFAEKIYEDLDTLEMFECRAWVTVGKVFKPEDTTKAILAQVDPSAHEMILSGRVYEEISKLLRESLKDKRYLIVLDDIWDDRVQTYAQRSFPFNGNGSRILVISRSQFCVKNFKFYSHLLDMRLLNKKESWDLLRDRVFGEGSCPRALEKAGKEIAEKCDGLPLTIIKVADLLSKADKTEAFWCEVAMQKKHQLFIDAHNDISEVLYPSYEVFSGNLKLCFLYIGVFPERYEIPKSKLINLWIAEKFLQHHIFKYAESEGESFLYGLTGNNIVMVHERSSGLLPRTLSKSVKTCRLHSSWWHFCHKEATKNGFFHILDSYTDAFGVGIKSQSRLILHNNVLFAIEDVHNAMEENCAYTAHSLLCFGPYHQYPVPMCYGLKLLEKLDALNIRFYEFPTEVLELVMLRYLALTCNEKPPASICKLGEVEFLIVRRHLSIKCDENVSYLPTEIWDMEKLKHLQVTGCDLPNHGDRSLPKLSTLSNVSPGSCTKGVFERIPELNKLGIQVELMPDVTEPNLHFFDHISHLDKLESLTCVVVNPKYRFGVVAPLSAFPLGLRKLHLSGLGYPWEEISKIASLPNLEVLKLRCNAFQGPKWEVEGHTFKRLYVLLVEDMDIVQLKGESGCFKSLKYLSIKHCYKLKEVHLRRDIVSNIEVVDCNPLVEREIKASIFVQKGSSCPEQLNLHSSWKS